MLRAGEGGERGPVRSTEPAGLLLSRARGAVAGGLRSCGCGCGLVVIVGLGRGMDSPLVAFLDKPCLLILRLRIRLFCSVGCSTSQPMFFHPGRRILSRSRCKTTFTLSQAPASLWLGQVSNLAISVGIVVHKFRTRVPLFRILTPLINSVEHVDFNTRLESCINAKPVQL